MPSTTTTTYTVTWPNGTTEVYVTTGTPVESTDTYGNVTWVTLVGTKDGGDSATWHVHLGIARSWSKTVVTT